MVKVEFASLNPCDFKFRRAVAPAVALDFLFPKPKITTEDLAGTVVAVGPRVAAEGTFSVGDRVAAMLPIMHSRWGALAQYAAVDASHAALVPDGVALEQAAAVPLVALTVLQALAKLGGGEAALKGRSVLVQAGAGGVGTFAVQWCSRVLGMRVAATASPRNHELLESLGAARTIDYRTVDFDDGEPGFDVVIDPMSYEYEARTLNGKPGVMASDGHYLNILGSDFALDAAGNERGNGPTTLFNMVRFGAAWLIRAAGLPALTGEGRSYSPVFVSPSGADLSRVLSEMGEGGRVRAVVDRTYALAEAAQAFDYLEQGHAQGKVLIRIPRD